MNLLKVANVAKRVRNSAERLFILFATPRIALPVVFNHASIFEQQPEPVKRDGFTVYKTGLKINFLLLVVIEAVGPEALDTTFYYILFFLRYRPIDKNLSFYFL